MKSDFERVLLYGNNKMNITYLKVLNSDELEAEFKNKIEKKIKEIETKDKDSSSKARLKSDRVEITWMNEQLSFEKADSISFDDKKVNIEYENESIIIPLKNIKKLKFPSSLLDKKIKHDWSWNTNLGYYDDTTTNYPSYWYPK